MRREGRHPGIEVTYRVLPRMGGGGAGKVVMIKGKPSRVPPASSGPRWSGYHLHPTVRAKDKTKGSNKKRSHDDSPWRASYSGGGFSSASVLDRLARQDYFPDRDEEEDEDEDEDEVEEHCGDGYLRSQDYGEDVAVGVVDLVVGCGPHSPPIVEIRDVGGGVGNEEEEEEGDDDDDCMSFCDVGFVVDQIEGEEDWCLVEEM